MTAQLVERYDCCTLCSEMQVCVWTALQGGGVCVMLCEACLELLWMGVEGWNDACAEDELAEVRA